VITRRQAENAGHEAAQEVGDLGGGVERERLLAGPPFGDDAAGFERTGDEALAGDALFDHDLGVAESLGSVAAFLVEGEGNVVGPFGMYGGGAGGEGLFGVGDGGQGLVIDLDEIGGVGRDVAVGGDDDGHGMSDEVDAVAGQQVVVRHA